MARRYSLPFKTLIGTEIEILPWHYRTGGDDWIRIEHEGAIPSWDYLTNLEFSRDLRIDGDKARTACGLGLDAELDLVVTLISQSSRFRSVVYRGEVANGSSTQAISFKAPSDALAESVRLETEVILATRQESSDEFAPSMAGSRLFSEFAVFAIEGTRSRMPIEIAAFGSQLAWLNAPMAPWFVSFGSGDLHAPVMRDLRVFLNSDQPAYAVPAQNADPLLVGLISSDVAASLIGSALDDADFVSGSTDYGEESIGQAAAHLLGICFPSLARQDVAQLARENPARFMAAIRSSLVISDV